MAAGWLPVDRVAGGDGAAGVIGVDVAMPTAASADVAEQRCGFAFSGQAGELVDGGDDECRRQPVDLLIDGEHRQALGDGAALGEGQRASSSPQWTYTRRVVASALTWAAVIGVPHHGQR